MRNSSWALLLLLVLFGNPLRARADLDDSAGDYAKNPGLNPSTPPQGQKLLGETEPDPEREAIKRAKKSMAKTVVEGAPAPSSDASGAGASLGKTLTLKTELEYAGPKRRVKTVRTVHLSDEHSEWLSLTYPRDGVALVGRIKERGAGKVKFEYIIVDTSREDEGVISPPPLEVPIGQRLMVNLDGQGTRITLHFEASWRKQ